MSAGSHVDMNYATNVLTITEGSSTYTLNFNPTESFAGEYFSLAPDNGGAGPGTEITESGVACYCRGTLIATERGEVAVEDMAIGDRVVTESGALRPIKWIGRRSYAGRFVMGRSDMLPVCIKSGALADNVPRRDLWISPNHAMYFENEHRRRADRGARPDQRRFDRSGRAGRNSSNTSTSSWTATM